MAKGRDNRLTADRPATYRIKVPGVIDLGQADWVVGVAVTVEGKDRGIPIMTLTREVDHAAVFDLLIGKELEPEIGEATQLKNAQTAQRLLLDYKVRGKIAFSS